MKVGIFTYQFTRPDFLPYQVKSFRRFLLDADYEVNAVDNCPDKSESEQVKRTCGELGIRYHLNPDQCHDLANLSAYRAIQWSYNNIIVGGGYDLVLLLDSDVFFISEVGVGQTLEGYDIAAVPQGRLGKTGPVQYVWVGAVFMDMRTLPDANSINFYPGEIDGARVDVGGHTHCYLQSHPEVRWRRLSHTSVIRIGSPAMDSLPECARDTYKDEYASEVLDGSMLHYRVGSNWEHAPQSIVDAKSAWLFGSLDGVLGK